eukprot:2597271-Heterocapsa_arctica.AAC.1
MPPRFSRVGRHSTSMPSMQTSCRPRSTSSTKSSRTSLSPCAVSTRKTLSSRPGGSWRQPVSSWPASFSALTACNSLSSSASASRWHAAHASP